MSRQQEAAYAAQAIRTFLDGSCGDRDWDNFTSCSLRNAEVDSIRRRALDVPLPVGPDEDKALAALADEADCMSNWTGSPPLRVLDELAAFDAMRRFLEIWWEVGGRSEDNIAKHPLLYRAHDGLG